MTPKQADLQALSDAASDGPNTHKYRDATFVTSWHVFRLTDPDGVEHVFHVPSRIVEQIEIVGDAARAATPVVPAEGPWDFEPLTGDGWAILGPDDEERHGDWSVDGYGRAIALDREDAERIVNALNAAASPSPDTDSVPFEYGGALYNRPSPDTDAGLDVAWKAAEAALSEGWIIDGLRRLYVDGVPEQWVARATQPIEADDTSMPVAKGYGPTPAAALARLATPDKGQPE